MAGTTVIAAKLTLDASQPAQSVKSFKTQLKESQAELIRLQQSFGDLSPQAIAAARRVAELRDSIQDAREVADLFDPGKKFQAFAGALSTVAAGYGAVQGAMGLFGAESKELEKQLLKVQSAMALAQGLSAIADGAKDFQRLGLVAKEALAGIRTGLIATGIGAFIVALGTIVAYWDDIKEAVSGVSASQRAILTDATKLADKEKEKLTHIDEQDNILKSQGKSEKEILELKEQQIEAVIQASEAQLAAQKEVDKVAIATAERNKYILTQILQFVSAPLELITMGIDAIGEKFGKNFGLNSMLNKGISSIAGLVFDPKGMKEEADKSYKEQEEGLLKLRNQYAGYQNQIKELNKAAAEKERAFQKEISDIRSQAETVRGNTTFIHRQEELDRQNAFAQKAIEAELLNAKDRAEKLAAQEALYQAQTDALKQEKFAADFKRDTEQQQAVIDARKKQADQLTNDALNAENMLNDQHKANAEARKEADQIALDNKERTTQAEISLLYKFSDLLGKQTVAGKALAIAATVMDTYQSATASYKSLAGIPIVGPALGFAAAAAAIGAGLANVKRIISTPIPGQGGGGSAPSIDSGGMAAPLVPRPQVTNTALPQDQLNQIGNAAVRAYVLESDNTSSQEKITRINRQARLGG